MARCEERAAWPTPPQRDMLGPQCQTTTGRLLLKRMCATCSRFTEKWKKLTRKTEAVTSQISLAG